MRVGVNQLSAVVIDKRSVALTDSNGRIIRRGALTTDIRVMIPFPTYVLACR